MKAHNLVLGALHVASGRFADFWAVAKIVESIFEGLPYDADVVRSVISDCVGRGTENKGATDQQTMCKRLIAEDLARAAAVLDRVPSAGQFEENLRRASKSALGKLEELGIVFCRPAVRIVEQFPRPYEQMDWVAFAPDRSDERNYGIAAGIYLKAADLAPFFSEMTLAHEIIHCAVGAVNPELLGRGLEDGLADLLGSLYLGKRVLPVEIVRNVYMHGRLGSELEQANRLYVEYARQAYAVYLRFGLDGIVQLVKGGREMIKTTEELMLSGRISAISLPKGTWETELDALAQDVLMARVPTLIVSPISLYVAEHAVAGASVSDIARSSEMESQVVRQALEELQARTFTLLLDGDRIAYSDLPFIARSGALRYEVIT